MITVTGFTQFPASGLGLTSCFNVAESIKTES